MADVNANIGVNIDASNALAQLKALQRQISQFHTSVAKSSESASLAQRDLQKNFLNSVNAIGAFSAELRTVRTTAESFTNSLEKNKFSMREYFRYAGASTKTFGKLFRSEFDTINKVAEERVKKLQTQYIKMGRDATGAMKAIAIMPTSLDMKDFGTQVQIAAQKQALFNQLMRQGSTNLLNFGKNTQWAGRQLMVGFTLPLAALGTTAARTFMEMEAAALKFRKVYGDLFTPATETARALEDITTLGEQFTKYGIAVSQTVSLAAEAAAAGFQGLDLQRQTIEATRLQVLGQVDQQKALETTIALQNAFQMSSENLADAINFLNAVENQTVVSLDDITTAIPKAAPVVRQLGGDVKDLAFFMAAMKEGGINASEGANALKSGLASLINPTDKASEMLAGFGININQIVEKNVGNVKQTVIDFALALDNLSDLNRQRAIEQLFGKFQLARLSTLFENVTRSGNQASRVLDLATASTADLAEMAEKELGMTAESSMNKFRKAVEDLKLALVPVGEVFLQAVTPIVEFFSGVLEKFNGLSSGAKKAITILTVAVGAIGPVLLMTFGLLANGIANLVKGFMVLRNGYLRLTGQSQILGEQTQYLTSEQMEAAAVAASLDQSHSRLTQTFNVETEALNRLIQAYQSASRAGSQFAINNPGMMMPPKKYNKGVVVVPGSGNKDTVPAMLTPGEAVIPADMTQKYGALINGMIAGNIPGYQRGKGFRNATMYLPESINTRAGSLTGPGVPTGDITSYLQEAGSASMGPLLAVIASQIKAGLTNPKYISEWQSVGDTFAKAATKALNDSGKTFIKDIDLEEIVVPALKDAAAGITVAGKEIDTALDNAINQIRTVGPVGVGSGSTGGAGRTALPGSYKNFRPVAQQFALATNPEMFEQTTRFSQSRDKEIKSFKTFNPAGKDWEVATMSHITQSVTASTEELISQVSPYLGDKSAEITKAVVKSTVSGVEKGLSESVKVASPSKETERIGAEIGKGAIIGMEGYVDDAKVVGEKIGSSTVQGLSSGGRRIATSPGGPVGPGGVILTDIQEQMSVSEKVKDAAEEQAKAGRINADRISRMNSGLMSATFAISSLAGITTLFADGPLSKFSGTISKLTGLMFVLMSVTQALTQTQILKLASDRAQLISGAMLGLPAGGKAPLKSLFTGITGFLPKLKLLGSFTARFLGPIGIATTAISLMAVAIKINNNRLEEQRKKLEAFSDALEDSKPKEDFLSEYFGFIPQTDSLKNFGEELEALSVVQRTEREKIKESPGFQKGYGGMISSVSMLSDEQAKTALTLEGLKLISQGMAKEKVDELIGAIKEEAGKTNVKLDFASLKFDDAGIKQMNAEMGVALKDFQTTYISGISELYVRGFDEPVKIVSKESQAALKNSSMAVASYVTSISRLARNGSLTLEQYNKTFDGLFNTIKESTPDTTAQLALFNKAVSMIDPDLAKLIKGVDDLAQKQLVLKAATVGVSEALIANFVLALKTADALNKAAIAANSAGNLDVGAIAAAAQARNKALGIEIDIKKAIEDALKIAKELNKVQGEGEGKTTVKGFLQEQIGILKNQIAAYKQLRIAKIDSATASELAGNTELAALLKTKAGVQQNIAAIKEYAKLKREAALIQEAGADIGDATIADLNRKKAFLDLQEQLITMRYSHELERQNKALQDQEWALEQVQRKIDEIEREQIRPLQDIIEENTFALETIGFAEDKINAKYDEQERILENILEINQDIENVQKARLTVADALTSGDISAAAKAVEDLRNQQRNISSSNQRKVLQNARKQEIAALGRIEIEEKNKKLQFEINKIQFEQTRSLEKQKVVIQDNIKGIQEIVQDIEYVTMVSIRKMTDEISKRFGGTKIEIENALKVLDLSKAAGIDINSESFITNVLKAAGGYASYINKLITDTPDLFQAVIDEIAKLRAEMELPIIPKIDTAPISEQYLAPKLEVSLPIMKPDSSCPSGWAYYIETYVDEGQGQPATLFSSIFVGCSATAAPQGTPVPTPVPTPTPTPTRTPSATPKPTTVTPAGPCTAAKPYYNYYTGECVATLEEVKPRGVITPTPTASATPKPTVTLSPSPSPTPKASATPSPTINPALNAGLNTGGSTAQLHLEELDRIARATAYANSIKSITQNAGTVAANHYADLAKLAEATAKANAAAAAKNQGANIVPTANMPFGGGSVIPKATSGGGGGLYGSVQMLAKGGYIKPKYMAVGGFARGSDKIPAMLSPGEFVMSRYAVENYGVDRLKAINNGDVDDSSVYNYSINVNVKSGANPDEIARSVMTQIKQIDSQRIRGQRVS